MGHHGKDFISASSDIHCATDITGRVLRQTPVCEITIGSDLKGTKHRAIEPAAAGKRKGIRMMDKRRAWDECREIFPGIA